MFGREEFTIRCHICDRLLSQPRYNRELKAWEPCEECTEVIQDVINSYKDNAIFTDDDFETQDFPFSPDGDDFT